MDRTLNNKVIQLLKLAKTGLISSMRALIIQSKIVHNGYVKKSKP
jgi:hypothetical protein